MKAALADEQPFDRIVASVWENEVERAPWLFDLRVERGVEI
jgi:hypothetical protein